jgi:hypothetical protein
VRVQVLELSNKVSTERYNQNEQGRITNWCQEIKLKLGSVFGPK